MKISKRTQGGWTKPEENKSSTNCDNCNSNLYIAPHGGIFCDEIHNLPTRETEYNKNAKR
jgi:hypothetical protein